jgi:hypothetical protein
MTKRAQAEAVAHAFKPQEVSNLLWAYAKLGHRPPHMLLVALWEGVGVDAAHSASASASSIGGALPAAFDGGDGTGGGGGGGAADYGSASASARLSAFKPSELSMLVWALAVLKVVPGAAGAVRAASTRARARAAAGAAWCAARLLRASHVARRQHAYRRHILVRALLLLLLLLPCVCVMQHRQGLVGPVLAVKLPQDDRTDATGARGRVCLCVCVCVLCVQCSVAAAPATHLAAGASHLHTCTPSHDTHTTHTQHTHGTRHTHDTRHTTHDTRHTTHARTHTHTPCRAPAQSLANIIWALSELQLQPPPAWLYHWAAAARAALAGMSPIDLGQVAGALQGPTLGGLQLPKLDALLSDVLAQLAAVERGAGRGGYSRAAMELLLRMQSMGGGSTRPRAGAGSGGGGVLQLQQPSGGGAAASGGGSSSSSSSSSSDGSVPQLKALLAVASASLDDH